MFVWVRKRLSCDQGEQNSLTIPVNRFKATAAGKSLQSCPTLCDPIDSSPPGSPVSGILQARTRVGCHFLLQCMKVKMKVKSLSRVRLLATPWTAAHQAPLSMGFSRQEYWSGCHCLLWQLPLHQTKSHLMETPLLLKPKSLQSILTLPLQSVRHLTFQKIIMVKLLFLKNINLIILLLHSKPFNGSPYHSE